MCDTLYVNFTKQHMVESYCFTNMQQFDKHHRAYTPNALNKHPNKLAIFAQLLIAPNHVCAHNNAHNIYDNALHNICDNALHNIYDNALHNKYDNALHNIYDNALHNMYDNALHNIYGNALHNI